MLRCLKRASFGFDDRLFTAVAIAALPIVLSSTASGSEERRGNGSAAERATATVANRMAEASPSKQGESEQDMAGDFFEVLLKWTPSGADPHVREWLEGQGLTAIPMKAGMLTVASRSQIENSFGVSVEDVQPPFELPVPEELRPYLSSVTFLKPRSYH
jgi:hypothetical protein